jgi:hypothetical protein
MPQEELKPGLRLALRLHEIGDASPYELSYAAKGKSGASFGFMQGDLAAGQGVVTQTFIQAMTAAGMDAARIQGLLAQLARHLLANPLGAAETAEVNNALLASRALVDAMDEMLLQDVYRGLDRCVATAAGANRLVEAKAQLYMALWINMTGPPTTLLVWLTGGNPNLPGSVSPPGATVDGAAMEQYLRATAYYMENPGNFPHMISSAAAGMAALGSGPAPAPRAAAVRVAGTTPLTAATARQSILTRAAATLNASGLRMATAAVAGPTSPAGGQDVGEFATIEARGVFTSNRRWVDEPLTPQVLDLYFTEAPVDGFDFEAFNRHVAGLGLAHFKAIELLFLGSSNSAGTCQGKNNLPPQSLWSNIDNTARMLDRIRDLLGAPIRILSAYRAPDYNSCIGGVSDSQHVRFNALDWTCDQGTPTDWHAVARRVRDERPEFEGGIGIYQAGLFIHIDTRGQRADWSGPG